MWVLNESVDVILFWWIVAIPTIILEIRFVNNIENCINILLNIKDFLNSVLKFHIVYINNKKKDQDVINIFCSQHWLIFYCSF